MRTIAYLRTSCRDIRQPASATVSVIAGRATSVRVMTSTATTMILIAINMIKWTFVKRLVCFLRVCFNRSSRIARRLAIRSLVARTASPLLHGPATRVMLSGSPDDLLANLIMTHTKLSVMVVVVKTAATTNSTADRRPRRTFKSFTLLPLSRAAPAKHVRIPPTTLRQLCCRVYQRTGHNLAQVSISPREALPSSSFFCSNMFDIFARLFDVCRKKSLCSGSNSMSKQTDAIPAS